MRSWNHPVIEGQWRHITRKWFFEFVTQNHPRAIKNNVTCSTRREEHAGRWISALAPSEAKLSAITDSRDISALDLTSEITGWTRTLVYIPIASSRGGLHARFLREALTQSGVKRQWGSHPPVPWKDWKWPVPARVKVIDQTMTSKVRSSAEKSREPVIADNFASEGAGAEIQRPACFSRRVEHVTLVFYCPRMIFGNKFEKSFSGQMSSLTYDDPVDPWPYFKSS